MWCLFPMDRLLVTDEMRTPSCLCKYWTHIIIERIMFKVEDSSCYRTTKSGINWQLFGSVYWYREWVDIRRASIGLHDPQFSGCLFALINPYKTSAAFVLKNDTHPEWSQVAYAINFLDDELGVDDFPFDHNVRARYRVWFRFTIHHSNHPSSQPKISTAISAGGEYEMNALVSWPINIHPLHIDPLAPVHDVDNPDELFPSYLESFKTNKPIT